MICMEEDGMKRVLFKLILPMAFIVIWLDMCYWICLGENGMNWLQFWIMGGFPFGIQKMLVLLIRRNSREHRSVGIRRNHRWHDRSDCPCNKNYCNH